MATFRTIIPHNRLLVPLQLLAILTWLAHVESIVKFAREPQDQSALIGTRVILPCRVENLRGVVQWTQNQFGLGTDRHLPGYDRYSMIGSDDEGDYSLEIRDVVLEDDGKYQCQVSGRGAELRSNTAKLTVLVPPDAPTIEEQSLRDFSVSENRNLRLTCVSSGGKPAAEITWIDGLGNVLSDGVSYRAEKLDDGYRFKSISTLQIVAKRSYHQTTFKCQAQNAAERTHQTAKIVINVTYAPKITLSVISSRNDENGLIREGANIVIECNTDANPATNLTYRWFVGAATAASPAPPAGGLLANETFAKIQLNNVTREYHGRMIGCEATNSVGTSTETETLNVSYAPVFRTSTRTIAAEENSSVNLFCDVDSNPPAQLSWYRDGSDRLFRQSDNFTLVVTPRTIGKYRCEAESKGFATITTETIVLIKGAPSISAKSIVAGRVGDEIHLYCSAMTTPASDTMLWSLNGDSVQSLVQKGHVSISDSGFIGGLKSVLTIHEATSEMFGEWRCTIRNQYGSDSFKIQLIQSVNESIMLLATTVAGSILTIVSMLAVFVFCCNRKCCKNATQKGTINGAEKSFDNQHDVQMTSKSKHKNDVKLCLDGSIKAIEANSSSSTVQIDSNFNDVNSMKIKSTTNLLRCQQYSNNIGIDNPYPDIGLPMNNKPKPQKKPDYNDISFNMYSKPNNTTAAYLKASGGSLSNILTNISMPAPPSPLSSTHQPPSLASIRAQNHRYSTATNEISAAYRQVQHTANGAQTPQYPCITHLVPNYQSQGQTQYLSSRSPHPYPSTTPVSQHLQYSTLPLQNHIENASKKLLALQQQNDNFLSNSALNSLSHSSNSSSLLSASNGGGPALAATASSAALTPPASHVTTTAANCGLLIAPKAYHYNNLINSHHHQQQQQQQLYQSNSPLDYQNSLKKKQMVIVSSNDQNSTSSHVLVNPVSPASAASAISVDETVKTSTAVIV